MRPTSRSSRRTTQLSDAAKRPAASGRVAAAKAPEEGALAPQEVPTSAASGRAKTGRPSARGSARAKTASGSTTKPGTGSVRSRQVAKPSKAPWFIGAFAVVAVIVIFSWRPVMRSIHLKRLDAATGAAGIEVANLYLAFEEHSETMVRQAIADGHGEYAVRLHLAKAVKSVPSLVSIIESEGITDAQRTEILTEIATLFDPSLHRGERLPSELDEWAEKAEDRALSLASIVLLSKVGVGLGDENIPELLTRIAGTPGQDPIRAKASLDALAVVSDSDNLGYTLGLLRSGTADQVIANDGLIRAIRSHAEAGHLPQLLELLQSPMETVRALSLETMGTLSLPDSADPRLRKDLGERVAAKLTAETPPIELAGALNAAKGLRLVSSAPALFVLLPQRAALALPGIDDQWWVQCLGNAFMLATPETNRKESEKVIAGLTEKLDAPTCRSVAALALGQIHEASFANLRPALDKLASIGDPECLSSLRTLVAKVFGREDVAKSCGDDPAAWQAFLAKDRPRAERIAEMRAFVDENRATQRISDGREKLGVIKDFLDKARDELQAWTSEANFVPPIGATKIQVDTLFRDVQELNVSVRKAYSGAL